MGEWSALDKCPLDTELWIHVHIATNAIILVQFCKLWLLQFHFQRIIGCPIIVVTVSTVQSDTVQFSMMPSISVIITFSLLFS